MISTSEKKILDNVFYEQDIGTRGLDTFKRQLKKDGIDIGKDKIKFYYDNQEVVQIFKKKPKYVKLNKINIGEPFSKIYIDTMFLTSANITVINIIDFFTKFALIRAFKGGSTSSTKTTEAIKEYIEEVKKLGYTIGDIYSDNGTEFMGEFNKYLSSKGINHIFTAVNDKRQTSPVESFNKTVRSLFEKYNAIHGFNITKLFSSIKKINNIYNNAYHSSLGYSPLEIVEDPKKQKEYLNKWKLKKKTSNTNKLKEGDYIRLPIEKDTFSSLSPNWTKKLYKIVKYNDNSNRYIIEGLKDEYPPNMVQYVDVDNLMRYKGKFEGELKKKKKNKELDNLKDFLGEGEYYKEKRNLRSK
jgi:transposase InsO family protein